MAGEEGEGAEMVASVMDWEAGIPAAAIADVAAALAAAELDEEGGAAVGAGVGVQGGASSEAKAALNDLMEVLGDDEEEGGSWEDGKDEDEDEGVYLVDDDALADDANWKNQVRLPQS